MDKIGMIKATSACSRCEVEKKLTEFYKQPSNIMNNGVTYHCKQCLKGDERTELGVIDRIYRSMKSSSKYRGHPQPSFTKDEFESWLYSKTDFKEIYGRYFTSKFESDLKPSIDRIDDYKPYDISNMTVMTWGENKEKGDKDRFNGINNKQSKCVNKVSEDGVIIDSFKSTCAAGRSVNGHAGAIYRAASCGTKVYGFNWSFA